MGELRRLRARLAGIVTRAAVRVVNDAAKTQRLQVVIMADEVEDDVEHMQGFGCSFTPPVGSEAIVLAVNGSRAHSVALCVQHPDQRPQEAAAGEGGLYTEAGWQVYLKASDGSLHLGASGDTAAAKLSRDDRVQQALAAAKAERDALKTDIQMIVTALGGAPVAPMDGGSSFKAAVVAALAATPAAIIQDPPATESDNVHGT